MKTFTKHLSKGKNSKKPICKRIVRLKTSKFRTSTKIENPRPIVLLFARFKNSKIKSERTYTSARKLEFRILGNLQPKLHRSQNLRTCSEFSIEVCNHEPKCWSFQNLPEQANIRNLYIEVP